MGRSKRDFLGEVAELPTARWDTFYGEDGCWRIEAWLKRGGQAGHAKGRVSARPSPERSGARGKGAVRVPMGWHGQAGEDGRQDSRTGCGISGAGQGALASPPAVFPSPGVKKIPARKRPNCHLRVGNLQRRTGGARERLGYGSSGWPSGATGGARAPRSGRRVRALGMTAQWPQIGSQRASGMASRAWSPETAESLKGEICESLKR